MGLLLCCVAIHAYQVCAGPLSVEFTPLDFVHSVLHPGTDFFRMVVLLGCSFFLHANLVHLGSNMWYLAVFGMATEEKLGTVRLLIIYLACGAISILTHTAHNPFSDVPVVGASGAIAGIMGIHLVVLPFSRILVWVPPIFFIRVPSFAFLLLWFALQYMGAARFTGAAPQVAWWAHVGGFVCGVVCGLCVRKENGPAER